MYHQVLEKLDAVAIGGGSDSWQLIGVEKKCPYYGAGITSQYLPLDVYAYGDEDHIPNIPTYPCRVVSSKPDEDRTFNGVKLEKWPCFSAGHGCSAGGMALSLACDKYTTVGLIGFSGYMYYGVRYDQEGEHDFRTLVKCWNNLGKTLVSLMPVSVFNDLLVPAYKLLGTNLRLSRDLNKERYNILGEKVQ